MAIAIDHREAAKGLVAQALEPVAWRPVYWLAAAAPMAVLFLFEALQISFLETIRAPNVGIALQIALMFGFFALWPIAIRISWAAIEHHGRKDRPSMARLATWLTAIGMAGSLLHLGLLGFVLRIMYSPPGWGFSHLAGSIVETWLGYAGYWLLLYGFSCLTILRVRAIRAGKRTSPRIEVRQGRNIIVLTPAEIVWAEAAGNYVQIHSTRGDFMHRCTLDQLSRDTGTDFVRTHRSALVNRTHMRSIRRTATGKHRIAMSDDQSAPVSRRQLKEVRTILRSGSRQVA